MRILFEPCNRKNNITSLVLFLILIITGTLFRFNWWKWFTRWKQNIILFFQFEIEFLMSVGCKIFGDRMSSLKMPNKLHFTKWVSLITICGFITTKRLSTWPSKWGSRNFFCFFLNMISSFPCFKIPRWNSEL